MKGSHARQVPALFSMQEPKTDLEAILQICTFLSAPAVATRPWPPPTDIASAVTGMACAEKEQKGATPPLHTDATLQTCGGQRVKQREPQRFTRILEKSETQKPLTKNKAGHIYRVLGRKLSSRHLHKAIISASDYESRVMRGGNTRNSPKMSIPLRQ